MPLLVFLLRSFKLLKRIGRKLIRVEILKNLIDLFAKVAKIEMVKDNLAHSFLPSLIKIMKDHFENKSIIKNGIVS